MVRRAWQARLGARSTLCSDACVDEVQRRAAARAPDWARLVAEHCGVKVLSECTTVRLPRTISRRVEVACRDGVLLPSTCGRIRAEPFVFADCSTNIINTTICDGGGLALLLRDAPRPLAGRITAARVAMYNQPMLLAAAGAVLALCTSSEAIVDCMRQSKQSPLPKRTRAGAKGASKRSSGSSRAAAAGSRRGVGGRWSEVGGGRPATPRAAAGTDGASWPSGVRSRRRALRPQLSQLRARWWRWARTTQRSPS